MKVMTGKELTKMETNPPSNMRIVFNQVTMRSSKSPTPSRANRTSSAYDVASTASESCWFGVRGRVNGRLFSNTIPLTGTGFRDQ